jgi:hypothetical protein
MPALSDSEVTDQTHFIESTALLQPSTDVIRGLHGNRVVGPDFCHLIAAVHPDTTGGSRDHLEGRLREEVGNHQRGTNNEGCVLTWKNDPGWMRSLAHISLH